MFQEESKNEMVQLWLDLRQSTIPPQTALLHLANDIWDEYTPPKDKSFIVDKVLVNYNHNVDTFARDIREEFENEVGILSYSKESSQLHEMNSEGIMMPLGSAINVNDDGGNGVVNVNVDPMPVLEAVSRGEWVLLDIDENVDSGSISNLAELVSTCSISGGMFGLMGSNSEVSSRGMAFSCQTQSSIVEMGALIHSLSGNKGYKTTESGILVQSLDNNEDRVTGGGNASLEYAIVMPFDALLWKTTSFVFGNLDDN